MNPLRVENLESALAAFGIGFAVAVAITLFLHYGAGTLTAFAGKVAGTG